MTELLCACKMGYLHFVEMESIIDAVLRRIAGSSWSAIQIDNMIGVHNPSVQLSRDVNPRCEEMFIVAKLTVT